MIAVRTAIALIGGLLLLIGAAGFDVERRKENGAPTMALAIALIGAAVFVLAVFR